MILQALNSYYERKSSDLPPEGWINKGVDYVIVIDENGSFVTIECLQSQEGKKKVPRLMYLPNIGKQALKHTNSGKDANLLWDKSEFVFGIGGNANIKLSSFIETIERKLGKIDDMAIPALLNYLKCGQKDSSCFDTVLKNSEYGEEISAGSPVISFRMIEDNGKFIFERPKIFSCIVDASTEEISDHKGVCLVTGELDQEIDFSHTVIKGVCGTQTSGAVIVSFNEAAFCSYRKSRSLNAPVSKMAVQKYVKALNHLLKSNQRIQVGDASTVFWSDKQSHLEDSFSILFDEPPKDNPDRLTDAVKALYKAVDAGVLALEDKQTRFFVLGLSPNAARISVRFWHVGTVDEFSKIIIQHFRDLELVHWSKEKDYLPFKKLLGSIAMQEDDPKNIPPNIVGEWMRCILAGLPYPESLFQAALRRIRTEREVNYARAAILKACLNRSARFQNQPEKEMAVSLDIENRNPGYLLGRLFASLEKIQEEASSSINTTISDRYYSAASGTPASVMPILLRLKNHHLAKLAKGRSIYFERLLGEIIGEITNFPSQLNLQDQGRFAIGYYHQRKDFFIKSESSNKG